MGGTTIYKGLLPVHRKKNRKIAKMGFTISNELVQELLAVLEANTVEVHRGEEYNNDGIVKALDALKVEIGLTQAKTEEKSDAGV